MSGEKLCPLHRCSSKGSWMNLKHLFFYIAYFTVLDNYKPLLTHNLDKNTNFANLINARDDLMMLTESTCDFLLRGYSKDEVIVALNDEQENTDKIEKLVTTVEKLLEQQYSKDNIIDIVVNNKEFETFYSQKNFWLKIKNTYFLLESTGILVIIVFVLYLLYALYKWFDFKFPWFKQKTKDRSNSVPEPDKPRLSPEKTTPKQLGQEHSAQNHSKQEQSEHTQTDQKPKTNQSEELDNPPGKLYYPDSCATPGSDEILDIDQLDFRLRDSIAQQIAHVKELGIVISATQFNTGSDETPVDTPFSGDAGEKFFQILEYARSKGLIPNT